MWTKQHQTFCITCGRTTNQVTRYRGDDAGGTLIAQVQCAEHPEPPSTLISRDLICLRPPESLLVPVHNGGSNLLVSSAAPQAGARPG